MTWLEALTRLQGVPHALVTVTAVEGSAPREPGAKLVVRADGVFFGTIGGGHLEQLVLDDARAAIARGASISARYPLGAKAGQCCGGVVHVFIDVLGTGPRVHVFGAGHVGQAIANVLSGTAFSVHMIDERPEWLTRLPPHVIRHDEPWDRHIVNDADYVLVMTHRHDLDEDIVAALCQRPLQFLGLIGSATKWKRFKHRLEQRGRTPAEIARITCPIGLTRAGKAPQEIAISVAAQLLQLATTAPVEADEEETRAPS